MSDQPALPPQGPGPVEMADPALRFEVKRALVWLSLTVGFALVVLLIQPIMLILAGLVLASMLDGGVRLVGRVLPIGRGWRLLIVTLAVTLFITGTTILAGVEITAQASELSAVVQEQAVRFFNWLSGTGLLPAGKTDLSGLAQQAMGSIGRLTSWVGTAAGAVGSAVMILAIGLFVAMEPRAYGQGLEWLVPRESRVEFSRTLDHMALVLRRLLAGRLFGMLFEGVLIWIVLSIGGVPMALLLGIITGILAFIPNIGAFVSGVLMVAVGFSAGLDTGLWAIGTYFVVQTFDGYVVIPLVARKTVDMPPALTLGWQVLVGSVLGLLGLMLADPLLAMIKTALERSAETGNPDAPPKPARRRRAAKG